MLKTVQNKISPADQKDILELENKIEQFNSGQMHEERFRHYRLTRGVYGQRQAGVQMFRTKLPFGKVTTQQLKVLAELARKYGNQNLHITTRQNIQLHFVKLDDAPAVWKGLTAAGLTAMGACGNTVRNITASPAAGIDPDEPFDITPYVQRTFEYFLRNPICQDMGRKIKIAFSSSERDSGLTFFHDFGFIPRIQDHNGKPTRGFKVVVGGGLGAVSIVAPTVTEFMPADDILPFMTAALRVFDRFGEREKRQKARMKFLVKQLGVEGFIDLVNQELPSVPEVAPFPENPDTDIDLAVTTNIPPVAPSDKENYELWLKSNVFAQKQAGYFGVYVKIHLGNLSPETAEDLADLVSEVAADDIRFTADQNLLLRYVKEAHLPYLFNQLAEIKLADPGYASIGDVTACPGTDTCALGVTNSTGLATELRNLVVEEYRHLLTEQDILIRISGCMNSCGQHMSAPIGFHGSSIRLDNRILPAMQVVLGGGIDPSDHSGHMADKVIKLPTRRIPTALRWILKDYAAHKAEQDLFIHYYRKQGKRYFYDLLKPLADTDTVIEDEFFDWGQDKAYIQSIGVGECAGVSYDMVGAILGDAVEKLEEAKSSIQLKQWPEAIYESYTAMIIAAKGYLLTRDIKCNTHAGIIEDFEKAILEDPDLPITGSFIELIYQMKSHRPEETFAQDYHASSVDFVQKILDMRAQDFATSDEEKQVISSYYKA